MTCDRKSHPLPGDGERFGWCELCSLLSDMKSVGRGLELEPLRSFKVQVLPLIRGSNVSKSSFNAAPNVLLPGGLTSSLNQRLLAVEEIYSLSWDEFTMGTFTAKVQRCIALHSRLPLGGLRLPAGMSFHMQRSELSSLF
jgi:hypothetical protein